MNRRNYQDPNPWRDSGDGTRFQDRSFNGEREQGDGRRRRRFQDRSFNGEREQGLGFHHRNYNRHHPYNRNHHQGSRFRRQFAVPFVPPLLPLPVPPRKLLVLDVNGFLCHAIHDSNTAEIPRNRSPDGRIGRKLVFRRPYSDEFLRFCFDKFDVGVWSSTRKDNLEGMVDLLLGNLKDQLLFCWDQSHCTDTGFKTINKGDKPLYLKELKKLWDHLLHHQPSTKYTPLNTLLIDDSPYKALKNPPYTAVFPEPYNPANSNDNMLGAGGELTAYLCGIADTFHVQKFVQHHHYGQAPISDRDPDWGFYGQVCTTNCRQSTDSYSCAAFSC